MTFRARSFALLAILVAATSLTAAERGFPSITIFPPEVHRGGPQAFDMAQDASGVLYFGTLHGLLTYDGAWWRLMSLPQEQAPLSVTADKQGRVVLGLVNDFGYLDHDANGSLQYRSLIDQLPENDREVGNVRGICAAPQGFILVTEQSLITWTTGAPRIVKRFSDPETSPRGCYADEHEAFLRGPAGLQRFDFASGRITPTSVTGRVQRVLRDADGRIVLAVKDQGLFLFRGNEATPFAPEASAWLKGKAVMGACALRDGRILLATRQNGVMVLERSGAIDQIIEEGAGLPDAVIDEAHIDRDGSVWLAMEGPIVRIDLSSPVTVFDARRGLHGSVSDVTRFAGRLYVCSTHGLFAIDEHGVAHRLDGMNEGAWRALVVGDELLIGTPKGIYRLRANETAPTRVVELEAEISDVVASPSDPSRVWLATRNGVATIHRDATGWKYEGPVHGSPEYVSSVVEKDGVVWCGTIFNGIARIDGARTSSPRVTRYGDGEMNVFEVGGRPVFVRTSGEVVRIGDSGHLEPDPLLSFLKAPAGYFIVAQDSRGNLWINSTPPRMFERTADGYSREGRPLVSVTAADIQTVRASADGTVWFAADKGLFRYDPAAAAENVAPQPRPLIRRVVAGENRVLFGGGSTASRVELRHNFGRMRIEFAPASYRPGVSYQYRLDPVDTAWSEWTEQPFIDYTTLEPSQYTFHLRARGPAMTPSAETVWSFTVRAPWYRTWWAYTLALLVAAGLVFLIIGVRTATLRARTERLEARVEEKTAELQKTVTLLAEANTRLEALSLEDDLTGIANRRYFERALNDEWNRARRREQPLALILVDLDHFKNLNDQRGHPAGDDCLRRVGAFLAETIRRSGEVVARYGGEEFAILLPGTDADGAVRVAETLRLGIERLDVPYGLGQRHVTASCGVASIVPTKEAFSPEVLVDAADRALYAAKHSGRNCVRVADETTKGTWLTLAT